MRILILVALSLFSSYTYAKTLTAEAIARWATSPNGAEGGPYKPDVQEAWGVAADPEALMKETVRAAEKAMPQGFLEYKLFPYEPARKDVRKWTMEDVRAELGQSLLGIVDLKHTLELDKAENFVKASAGLRDPRFTSNMRGYYAEILAEAGLPGLAAEQCLMVPAEHRESAWEFGADDPAVKAILDKGKNERDVLIAEEKKVRAAIGRLNAIFQEETCRTPDGKVPGTQENLPGIHGNTVKEYIAGWKFVRKEKDKITVQPIQRRADTVRSSGGASLPKPPELTFTEAELKEPAKFCERVLKLLEGSLPRGQRQGDH